MLFPENELIYERKKKQEGQFLGNLSHGSKSKKVDIDTYHTLSYTITEIRNMLLEKKYPWLSVDLYIDSSLDVGVLNSKWNLHTKDSNHKMLNTKWSMQYNIT